jgi:hypothetical protein
MFIHGITPKIITMGIMLGMLCVSGCSQSEAPPVEPAVMPQISREALEAVREYRNEPINRARMTHSLGDARTQAIDEALKQ